MAIPDEIEYLASALVNEVPNDIMLGAASQTLRMQAVEVERLQNLIDSRPAINAGLPQSYIDWSQSIYAIEIGLTSNGVSN